MRRWRLLAVVAVATVAGAWLSPARSDSVVEAVVTDERNAAVSDAVVSLTAAAVLLTGHLTMTITGFLRTLRAGRGQESA